MTRPEDQPPLITTTTTTRTIEELVLVTHVDALATLLATVEVEIHLEQVTMRTLAITATTDRKTTHPTQEEIEVDKQRDHVHS